jgi:hypothetical protein
MINKCDRMRKAVISACFAVLVRIYREGLKEPQSEYPVPTEI